MLASWMLAKFEEKLWFKTLENLNNIVFNTQIKLEPHLSKGKTKDFTPPEDVIIVVCYENCRE